MKQQTAVEWLFMALQIRGLLPNDDIVKCYEQAKKMEKEQIKNAWGNERQVVFFDSFEDTLCEGTIKDLAEYYYNETYGGNK